MGKVLVTPCFLFDTDMPWADDYGAALAEAAMPAFSAAAKRLSRRHGTYFKLTEPTFGKGECAATAFLEGDLNGIDVTEIVSEFEDAVNVADLHETVARTLAGVSDDDVVYHGSQGNLTRADVADMTEDMATRIVAAIGQHLGVQKVRDDEVDLADDAPAASIGVLDGLNAFADVVPDDDRPEAFLDRLADKLNAKAAKARRQPGVIADMARLGDLLADKNLGPVQVGALMAAKAIETEGAVRYADQAAAMGLLVGRWTPDPDLAAEVLPEDIEDDYTQRESGHRLRVLDGITEGSGASRIKDTLRQYDWLTKTDMPLHGTVDAARVQAGLDAEYPWATELNEAAAELLALAAAIGKNWFWVPPLLLAGPPGRGKTRWARRAAELGGVGYHCLADVDRFAVSGSQRTWEGSEPCGALKAMAKLRSANPLICVDEIDKAPAGIGSSEANWGSAQEALLPFLERHSAARFFDQCLEGHVDARWVSWVLTANEIDRISSPLLDRCRVLTMPSPRPQDFDVLVRGILQDVARLWQCVPERLPELPFASIDRLRDRFEAALSPRALRKDVESALAKAAAGREWKPVDAGRVERVPIGFCR